MSERTIIQSIWDLPAAVMAVLLYGNFATFVVLLIVAMGLVFLEPAFVIVTAVFLLLGIACHFVTRRKTAKLWRRLLLGGVAANLVVMALYAVVVAALVMAWME